MLEYYTFHLVKAGNKESEYEDAFSPFKTKGIFKDDICSFAISDGASESSFAADWAKMLTRAFTKDPTHNLYELGEVTKQLGSKWYSYLKHRNLPWHAQEKVKNGAHASLLGLTIDKNESVWNAVAIGDSCLFHFRDEELIYSFPINKSGDFNNTPILLSSNHSRNNSVWESIKFVKSASLQVGDSFLLMTDAIAQWLLAEYESNSNPFQKIISLINNGIVFENLINGLRTSKKLKNDDVTILLLRTV